MDKTPTIDTKTGEIIQYEYTTPTFIRTSPVVGRDTPFPENIMDKKQYKEVVGILDPFTKTNNWNVCYRNVVASVRTKDFPEGIDSIDTICFLTYLCETSVAWNVWFGDIYSVPETMLHKRTKHYELVKDLKGRDIIRIRDPQPPGKEYRVDISPFYCWKGNIAFQTQAVNKWYSKR